MECGSLLSLFFFKPDNLSLCFSKQPKSHPLESISYKLQILQVFSFDIHANWWGVGDPHLYRKGSPKNTSRDETARPVRFALRLSSARSGNPALPCTPAA